MANKFYTGVGSRKTPTDVQKFMQHTAWHLQSLGYTLRTGDAYGADRAFTLGSNRKRHIYTRGNATANAMSLAAKFHPAWHRVSPEGKQLHARNAFQVLGLKLDDPSDFLICWTPDGCDCHKNRTIATGGTGTAISIADYYNVPILNLANVSEEMATFEIATMCRPT